MLPDVKVFSRVMAGLAAGALLASGCAGPASSDTPSPTPTPTATPTGGPGGSATPPQAGEIRFRFETPATGGCYRDVADLFKACVRSKAPLTIPEVTLETGLDFPAFCTAEPCDRLMLEVPDAPELNPGERPFRFGAELMLRPEDRSTGSNVVEKGFFDDPGGQWKLQIDGRGGRPSCVVQGVWDGKRVTARAYATRAVGDGRWHTVTCVRTESAVVIEVDGAEQGRADLPTGTVVNTAPVVIGAKNLQTDNDQFHGALRAVFLHVEKDGAPEPTAAVTPPGT
ncbi:MAG: hypothetical protein GEV11_25615 [Streptosporangiales bacterium]|nr:hypothetical protein [Streptosporangiales bacterium]